MLSYKKLNKDIKNKLNNTSPITSNDIKDIVNILYKQNVIRSIKYDKLINEITSLTNSNTTTDSNNDMLQVKYNKLRSQLETLISLIIELRKTEKKALLDIQIDIQNCHNEYIEVHNDYKVILLLI